MPTLLGETRDRRVSVQEQGDNVIYSETINFLVRADHKDQTREEILNTPGFPVVGLTSSTNGLGYCKSSDAQTDPQNPIIWRCSAEFSTPEPGKEANTGSPLEFVPIATASFDLIDEVSYVDADGNAVVNSAGQPWDTGIVIKRPVTHFSFVQFEPASTSLEEIRSRNGVINENSYALLNADPAELLVTVDSAEIGTYYKEYCWRIRYKMTHKDFGWKIRRLDTGTKYKNGSSGLLPYLDDKGNRIVGNLNGSGAKTGNGGQDPPAIRTFTPYRESDLAFIRLA